MSFTAEQWNERYEALNTPWDLGQASRPIRDYIDQLEDRSIRILVPGAGNAHEVSYLWERGFTQVHVLDWAAKSLENFHIHHPDFPENQMIQGDFFTHQGQYDLIIEQTFFCALDPSQRPAYALHCHDLLKSGGKLAGLLFQFPLRADGPPFGGSKEEYLGYFDDFFDLRFLETAYNSEENRSGKELFFLLKKH